MMVNAEYTNYPIEHCMHIFMNIEANEAGLHENLVWHAMCRMRAVIQ